MVLSPIAAAVIGILFCNIYYCPYMHWNYVSPPGSVTGLSATHTEAAFQSWSKIITVH